MHPSVPVSGNMWVVEEKEGLKCAKSEASLWKIFPVINHVQVLNEEFHSHQSGSFFLSEIYSIRQ